MRVGFGYDVHRLEPGRPLILGGVEIPFARGLAGHSDADVLVHAIMDALLGAAGLGDIGTLFPDTDPAYAGADSIALLRQVAHRLQAAGWRVANVDSTLLCERPRIAPHRQAMSERIAQTLGIAPEQVGVKATTNEGMGFVGRGEGIAAYAVALVVAAGQQSATGPA